MSQIMMQHRDSLLRRLAAISPQWAAVMYTDTNGWLQIDKNKYRGIKKAIGHTMMLSRCDKCVVGEAHGWKYDYNTNDSYCWKCEMYSHGIYENRNNYMFPRLLNSNIQAFVEHFEEAHQK